MRFSPRRRCRTDHGSAAGEKEVLAVTFPRPDLYYKPACTPLPVNTASVKPPPQVLVSSLHTPGMSTSSVISDAVKGFAWAVRQTQSLQSP